MKIKPKYGVFSNMLFTLRNIIRLDKVLLIAMIAMVFATVVQPVITILMPKYIVQFFEEQRGIEYFITLIIVFGIVSLVVGHIKSFADGYFPRKKSHYRSMRLGAEMCVAALNVQYKYLSSEEGQTDVHKARRAMSRPTVGVENMVLRMVLCSTNLIGAIIYTLILSSLNLWVIVGLIVCGMISFFVGYKVNDYRVKHKETMSKIEKRHHYTVEACGDLKHAKDIRMYGMFEYLVKTGQSLINDSLSWEKKITKRIFISHIIDGLIACLRDGVAYIYLIYMVINNNISVSEFLLYISSITGFSLWISNLVNNSIYLGTASIKVSDFRVFMEKADDNIKFKLPEQVIEGPIDIEFKDVCFSYGEKKIFENFNLKIEAGKKLALVGVNGAGKSTLVKLLLNLVEPDSGQILINGIDSNDIDIHQYFDQFSVAFQDAFILAYGIDVNIAMKEQDAIDQEKLKHVIKQAGLEKRISQLKNGVSTSVEKYLDSEGIDLSGGERQKIVLARALYKDAPVLVLDEPSSALDPIAEAELYEKYHEMTDNKTAVYISHRLSSTKFCDEVLLLDGGKVVERGTHEELMTLDGAYANMFNVQSQYYHAEEVEVIS